MMWRTFLLLLVLLPGLDASGQADRPEGVLYDNLVVTTSSGKGYQNAWYTGAVVEGTDGKVYIYGLLPSDRGQYNIFSHEWVCAERRGGDTIVVRSPQKFQKSYYPQYEPDVFLYASRQTPEGFSLDAEASEHAFLWRDGCLTQIGDEWLSGYQDWPGYGLVRCYSDRNISMVPLESSEVSGVPDDAELMTFRLRCKLRSAIKGTTIEGTRTVRGFIKDSHFYLGSFAKFDQDRYIKGRIIGNQVYFPTNQYLGVSNGGDYHVFAHMIDVGAEDVSPYYYTFSEKDEIMFTWNEQEGTLVSEPSQGILICKGDEMHLHSDYFVEPELTRVEETAATPAAPQIEEASGGGISFKQYYVDTDGNPIIDKNLFYNIYLDDEVYTFTSDKYYYIHQDITDIPNAYEDRISEDFQPFERGTYCLMQIFLYERDRTLSRIGVQSVYRCGGEECRSEISYKEVGTNAIRDVVREQAGGIAATYDLQGRRVEKPTQRGIYLKGGRKYVVR